MRTAALEWVTVVQDLFLEGASPARIAAWLDGTTSTGTGYVAVKRMRAIEGFDATILVRDERAVAFSVWYRDLERPTLADAEALFGAARYEPRRMFELVFASAARPLDHGIGHASSLVISCSASGNGLASAQRFLAGIALDVR